LSANPVTYPFSIVPMARRTRLLPDTQTSLSRQEELLTQRRGDIERIEKNEKMTSDEVYWRISSRKIGIFTGLFCV